MTIESGGFTPPIPVNYSQTGRVGVVGTPAFPLQTAKSYLIEVTLKSGPVKKIFRQYSVIRGQIVTIRINDGDLVLYNPTVYAVGMRSNPHGSNAMACYWKDGVKTDLPVPSRTYYNGDIAATGIAVSGNTVYVSGYYVQSESHVACYWINGVRTDLPGGGRAFDIAVDGGNVYMAGQYYYDEPGDPGFWLSMPCYWINGTRYDLPVPSNYGKTRAESIAVSGGTVYVAGFYFGSDRTTTGCYWVDGVRYDLPVPGGTGSFARGITVSGGDIYVLGGYGGTPCYWKNGITRYDLPRTDGYGMISGDSEHYSFGRAAIAVSDANVYSSGIVSTELGTSCYWKNGALIPLEGMAYGVTVFNDSVYVSGYHRDPDIPEEMIRPCYWKDGVPVDLQDDEIHFGLTMAYDIAVVE
jgi:hypothetical protein